MICFAVKSKLFKIVVVIMVVSLLASCVIHPPVERGDWAFFDSDSSKIQNSSPSARIVSVRKGRDIIVSAVFTEGSLDHIQYGSSASESALLFFSSNGDVLDLIAICDFDTDQVRYVIYLDRSDGLYKEHPNVAEAVGVQTLVASDVLAWYDGKYFPDARHSRSSRFSDRG